MKIAVPPLPVDATESRRELSDLERRQLVEQYVRALQTTAEYNVVVDASVLDNVIVDASVPDTDSLNLQRVAFLETLDESVPKDLTTIEFWTEAASLTDLLEIRSLLVFADIIHVAQRTSEPAKRISADIAAVGLQTPGRFDPVCSVGIERRFTQLSEEWKAESMFMSSATEIAMLPSYQKIIGIGPAVLPLIFRELEREPGHWFWALRVITDADPVPAESRGRIDEMARAWLRWGRLWGYQW